YSLSPTNASVTAFMLKTPPEYVNYPDSNVLLEVSNGVIIDFELGLEMAGSFEETPIALNVSSSGVVDFQIKEALISISNFDTDSAAADVVSGNILTFTLG